MAGWFLATRGYVLLGPVSGGILPARGPTPRRLTPPSVPPPFHGGGAAAYGPPVAVQEGAAVATTDDLIGVARVGGTSGAGFTLPGVAFMHRNRLASQSQP